MAEFLAPLIGISPSSRAPPVMAMRSIRSLDSAPPHADRRRPLLASPHGAANPQGGGVQSPVPDSGAAGSVPFASRGGAGLGALRRRRFALSAWASLASLSVSDLPELIGDLRPATIDEPANGPAVHFRGFPRARLLAISAPSPFAAVAPWYRAS